MGKLLEKAIEEANKLPANEQEAVGAWLLAELDSERRWDELFSRSGSAIEKIADDVIREHTAGVCEPLDPDDM